VRFRRNGWQIVAGNRTPLVQNENALKETDRALRAGKCYYQQIDTDLQHDDFI
jgi:hypothetical protein